MKKIIKIKDNYGKTRKGIKITCVNCNTIIVKRIYKDNPKFCNTKCFHKYQSYKSVVFVNCTFCDSLIKKKKSQIRSSKSRKYFCNRACKESFISGKNHPNWKGGLASCRNRAIKKYGLKCSNKKCKLRGINLPKFAFEIDHIDSDRNNNKLENLQILCILCHRIKTFKRSDK